MDKVLQWLKAVLNKFRLNVILLSKVTYTETLNEVKNFDILVRIVLFLSFSVAVSFMASFSVGGLNRLALPQPHIMIFWICMIFSLFLGTQNIFLEDFRNGILTKKFVSIKQKNIIILSKILSNWIVTCLPLIVISSLMLLALGSFKYLILSFLPCLIIATLSINFIGGLSSSLSLSKLFPLRLIVVLLTIPAVIRSRDLSDSVWFLIFSILIGLYGSLYAINFAEKNMSVAK